MTKLRFMYRISTAIKFNAFVLLFVTLAMPNLHAQNKSSTENYFRVENYYKVKWGFAEEFIALWTKNHYPLLKRAKEKGDIVSIIAGRPRYHSGEDTRWDFRVTILFRTAALAFDENLTTPYKKDLFPDQDAYAKAEQHRFELLLAHWDTETSDIDLP